MQLCVLFIYIIWVERVTVRELSCPRAKHNNCIQCLNQHYLLDLLKGCRDAGSFSTRNRRWKFSNSFAFIFLANYCEKINTCKIFTKLSMAKKSKNKVLFTTLHRWYTDRTPPNAPRQNKETQHNLLLLAINQKRNTGVQIGVVQSPLGKNMEN